MFYYNHDPLSDALQPVTYAEYDAQLSLELTAAAQQAANVGNTHAARNLLHWLEGSFSLEGSPINNYDVDSMLSDLPEFVKDIDDYMGSSVGSLTKLHPELARSLLPSSCKLWTNNTYWRRVGKPKEQTSRDIYPGIVNNALRFDLETFKRFLVETPSKEFDWYIAMNAFNYYIAQTVILDTNRGEGLACYKIYVQDRYAWYDKKGDATGALDRFMGAAETLGVGANYLINGSSRKKCIRFSLSNDTGTPQNPHITFDTNLAD